MYKLFVSNFMRKSDDQKISFFQAFENSVLFFGSSVIDQRWFLANLKKDTSERLNLVTLCVVFYLQIISEQFKNEKNNPHRCRVQISEVNIFHALLRVVLKWRGRGGGGSEEG